MRAATCDAAPSVPSPTLQRRLVVAWQHPIDGSISPVAMLQYDGEHYTFHYIAAALNVNDFRPFLGFPDLHESYTATRLFPLFAQRAMTPRRSDFTRWVHRLGLSDDATPWEQIARSGGRRQGDTIQLFPVPTIVGGRMTCDFLVHGIRHIPEKPRTVDGHAVQLTYPALEERLAALQAGDRLALHDEPDNSYNPHAILTSTTNNTPVGWVPDLLVEAIHDIPDRRTIDVTAAVVNGPEAGWHLRLLAHLTAEVPPGFRVFATPRWESLARH
ncbi:Uncharacterised protein [Mycobacteroides abscessus subsp. massiliense]|uniref:HIRAN domain-containing protein n=1 Tax=Mycobacteroides abscessus TaxID=36809 RepID=UPI0009A72584|nr:HIRAN domain-containing protein [Mycobacteroides abscessus]SKG00788.1 Uncharacterised protein [Mycobacteroides abscessus subsp. massiliense]SKG29292.1 Uncharacterised protein [Mycobacteroides abscessus subsp. massiliense]SKH69096.1 Uncharacterised protein [Mycobacteroides abscessus subsp. massiliense]SKI50664.1 Uncharacterised protein [Mycobacteroides abscessus subsp. massiliense]